MDQIVEVTRTAALDAPIGEVWQALTDSDALSRWLADEVELDVRPGGIGRLHLPDGDKSVLVTAVDEPRRLSLIWWADDGETSTVEMTLTEQCGGTELRVIERTSAPVAQACTFPWGQAVARLAVLRCGV